MKFFEPEEYQDKVNELFEKVREDIFNCISNLRFEHIGASSIKGSVSKGDLDIFVGVKKDQFNLTIEKLKEIGFTEKENTLRTNELCMMVTDKYNYDVAIQIVVNGSEFEDFIKFRGFNECKEAGKLRLEGKDYLVNDGDVMFFRVGS